MWVSVSRFDCASKRRLHDGKRKVGNAILACTPDTSAKYWGRPFLPPPTHTKYPCAVFFTQKRVETCFKELWTSFFFSLFSLFHREGKWMVIDHSSFLPSFLLLLPWAQESLVLVPFPPLYTWNGWLVASSSSSSLSTWARRGLIQEAGRKKKNGPFCAGGGGGEHH